ncbi:endonuclease/exonuclease/phosphatase family protein [Enterococcus sp. LJL128]
MKILTLNTHSWMEAEPWKKLDQLAEQITKHQYEVFALQEVNQSMTEKAKIVDSYYHPEASNLPILADNFAALLADKLQKEGIKYYWCWLPVHIGYGRYHEGLALFSKEPITAEYLAVSQATDFADFRTRKLLLGKTKVEEKEILFVNVHYSWWSDNSEEGFIWEWQQTMGRLSDERLPIILLGDFNNPAEREGEGYQLVSQNFRDSFLEAEKTSGEHTVMKAIDGWSENAEALRIDLVFTSDEFQIKSYEVLFDGRTTPVVSDHFGLEVQLEFQ